MTAAGALMRNYEIVQALTMTALTALLFSSGLRLHPTLVLATLADHRRLSRVVAVNFLAVPVLGLGLVSLLGVPRDLSIGVLLMSAAPFAPVVPVFARLCRSDLALAAALTALFPFFSSLLTPWVAAVCLRVLGGANPIEFQVLMTLLVLLGTITLPLLAGMAVHRWWPTVCQKLLRPVEISAESIGAVSLIFISTMEWKTIVATGWPPLLTMAVLFEASLAVGYWAGGPSLAARRVVALGTGNRNIALAILIAVRSFPGSPAVAAVVVNGLVVILLGLLHTAWWRLHPLKPS